MKHHRIWIVATILALSLLFNLERLDFGGQNTINISSIVYVLATALVLGTLILSRSMRPGTIPTVLIWMSLYVGCRIVFSNHPLLGGLHTYLTTSEAAFMGVLALLTAKLVESLRHFEDAVSTLTLASTDSNVKSIEAAADEVRRVLLYARRTERPLTVIAVEPTLGTRSTTIRRAVERLQQAMLRRFMVNTTANVVADTIRRTDIPVQKAADGRLLVVCPDTDVETANTVVNHISAALEQKVGVRASFGLASFPSEALSFDDLFARAEARLLEAKSAEDRPKLSAHGHQLATEVLAGAGKGDDPR